MLIKNDKILRQSELSPKKVSKGNMKRLAMISSKTRHFELKPSLTIFHLEKPCLHQKLNCSRRHCCCHRRCCCHRCCHCRCRCCCHLPPSTKNQKNSLSRFSVQGLKPFGLQLTKFLPRFYFIGNIKSISTNDTFV